MPFEICCIAAIPANATTPTNTRYSTKDAPRVSLEKRLSLRTKLNLEAEVAEWLLVFVVVFMVFISLWIRLIQRLALSRVKASPDCSELNECCGYHQTGDTEYGEVLSKSRTTG